MLLVGAYGSLPSPPREVPNAGMGGCLPAGIRRQDVDIEEDYVPVYDLAGLQELLPQAEARAAGERFHLGLPPARAGVLPAALGPMPVRSGAIPSSVYGFLIVWKRRSF